MATVRNMRSMVDEMTGASDKLAAVQRPGIYDEGRTQLAKTQDGPIAAMQGLTRANLARLHEAIAEAEQGVAPALRPDDDAEAPGIARDDPPFRSEVARFLLDVNGQLEHAVRRLEDIRRRSEF